MPSNLGERIWQKNASGMKAGRRVQLIHLIFFITVINLATNELTGGFSPDLHNLFKRTNKQAAIIHTNPLPPSTGSADPLRLSCRHKRKRANKWHKYHEAPINSSFVGKACLPRVLETNTCVPRPRKPGPACVARTVT